MKMATIFPRLPAAQAVSPKTSLFPNRQPLFFCAQALPEQPLQEKENN
jgi:hypothetical protein